jgi:hypothetical protein
MLLIGNGCLSADEERTQMAIWSVIASPLIMGNDMRNVSAASKAILLNAAAIAVNQDALGQQGLRLDNSSAAPAQRWARTLANGDVAVALYNKNGGPPPAPCPAWNFTAKGYEECCGPSPCFSDLTEAAAKAACCADASCAGFSFDPATNSGCFKSDTNCGFTPSSTYVGYDKPHFSPSPGAPVDITIASTTIHTGLRARDLVLGFCQQAPQIKPLVLVLKTFVVLL